MTTQEKLVRGKLNLLELAEYPTPPFSNHRNQPEVACSVRSSALLLATIAHLPQESAPLGGPRHPPLLTSLKFDVLDHKHGPARADVSGGEGCKECQACQTILCHIGHTPPEALKVGALTTGESRPSFFDGRIKTVVVVGAQNISIGCQCFRTCSWVHRSLLLGRPANRCVKGRFPQNGAIQSVLIGKHWEGGSPTIHAIEKAR